MPITPGNVSATFKSNQVRKVQCYFFEKMRVKINVRVLMKGQTEAHSWHHDDM